MSDSGEQSFVSRGLVGTASKRGPLDASRRVRVVDAGRGGWVGRVRCQCESALFPALDAWSVSLVTADLPVFTLSLHSSSSSGLQCTDLCDHAWLCGTCGFFSRHSYGFSPALHRPRWGPSSQSDRGALPCFMPRAVAFNLALPQITESRCAVRPPVLFKLV